MPIDEVAVALNDILVAFQLVRTTNHCIFASLQHVIAAFNLIHRPQNAIKISKCKIEVAE